MRPCGLFERQGRQRDDEACVAKDEKGLRKSPASWDCGGSPGCRKEQQCERKDVAPGECLTSCASVDVSKEGDVALVVLVPLLKWVKVALWRADMVFDSLGNTMKW